MFKRLAFLVAAFLWPTVSMATDIEGSVAVLGMLDKVTGRFRSERVVVGDTFVFEKLRIKVRACMYKPPEETPENTAYLEIDEQKKHQVNPNSLFRGWMFSSTHAVGMNSPVYDVWLLSCE